MTGAVFAVLSQPAVGDAPVQAGFLTLSHVDKKEDETMPKPIGDFTDIYAYLRAQKEKYSAAISQNWPGSIDLSNAKVPTKNNAESREKTDANIAAKVEDAPSKPWHDLLDEMPIASSSTSDSGGKSASNHTGIAKLENDTENSAAKTKTVKFHDFAENTKAVAEPYKRFARPADRSRSLLNKLAKRFPDEAAQFDLSSKTSIFAPARPSKTAKEVKAEVQADDRDVMIFVDHSNIIFGFLSIIRSQSRYKSAFTKSKKARLDYHSLFAIFERGRSATQRVLVGSTPLYQSLSPASAWHYDLHLLSRVLKYHDPADDIQERNYRHGFHTDSASEVEAESDDQRNSVFSRKSSQEQAVDELLHGKMYQSLFENRFNLPKTTLILASGDGAKSEFSPLGFRAPIEAALEAGAMVEIVCWKRQCSKVWEEVERKYEGKLQRIFLDEFMDELLE